MRNSFCSSRSGIASEAIIMAIPPTTTDKAMVPRIVPGGKPMDSVALGFRSGSARRTCSQHFIFLILPIFVGPAKVDVVKVNSPYVV